ncbi:MAG: HAD family hydrolase [Sphingobium sp.]|nr:HAD family hydrolase [Sphingobium sp.]
MDIAAVIYDFDGVIADSEILANSILADHVTALGLPTTVEQSVDLYTGRRWAELVTMIEGKVDKPLPLHFADDVKAATLERFRTELQPVPGALNFIQQFRFLPHCIASSSAMDRLTLCLDVLDLSEEFADRVFSAEDVENGKPAPDLFLHAADRLGVEPARCLVVEDSVAGVKAGVAADMIVVGLCAGAHIRPGHAERLRDAGAIMVAEHWSDIAEFLGTRV